MSSTLFSYFLYSLFTGLTTSTLTLPSSSSDQGGSPPIRQKGEAVRYPGRRDRCTNAAGTETPWTRLWPRSRPPLTRWGVLMDMAPLKPTLQARNLREIDKGDKGGNILDRRGGDCVSLRSTLFLLIRTIQINDLDPHAALFSFPDQGGSLPILLPGPRRIPADTARGKAGEGACGTPPSSQISSPPHARRGRSCSQRTLLPLDATPVLSSHRTRRRSLLLALVATQEPSPPAGHDA